MSATIREHQLALLQMLHVIDSICKKHDISYMLFSGTALGAVRHKGFIPWDDDLDIVMLRPEYERFMKLAEQEINTDIYFLQKEFSQHWPMFFSKLRKNNTACIEKIQVKDEKMHQGIYIDIFPCDNLSDRDIKRKLQYFLSKIVIAKSLDRRGYLTDSKKKKGFMIICRFLPQKPLWKFVINSKDKKSKYVHIFFGASSKYEKSIFPRSWFKEQKTVFFEDGNYPVSFYTDELLSSLYGDYMRIPSEKERICKIHSILTDLEHSYVDYLEWQKKQKITEFSRSIR